MVDSGRSERTRPKSGRGEVAGLVGWYSSCRRHRTPPQGALPVGSRNREKSRPGKMPRAGDPGDDHPGEVYPVMRVGSNQAVLHQKKSLGQATQGQMADARGRVSGGSHRGELPGDE